MKKVSIVLLFIAGLLSSAQAQKETYNWVFGDKAGLTWNTTRTLTVPGFLSTPAATLTGLPTSFSSAINTMEGCFSLSDSNGNLMFYSDGTTIWNKNHVPMPNGSRLTGHTSSAQSGIIIPYPGKPNQFLALTLGMTRANDLSYSVVDMNLEGGLGDVVKTQKNILFTGAKGLTGESVTAILKPNGTDYWILALGQQPFVSIDLPPVAPFYINAWSLTSSGVSSTPIVSTLPYALKDNGSSGYLKISPDGKHFVWPTFVDHRFFYGDFDINTGKFSNFKVKTGYGTNDRVAYYQPYGVEFSPDQKLIYLTDVYGLHVYKADALFTTSNPLLVPAKSYLITGWEQGITALQLGPDQRIYWSRQGSTIRIIDNPNDYDNLRIYQTNNGFITPGAAISGLPSFAASWFNAKAVDKSFVCTGNSYTFVLDISIAGANPPTLLKWDFGDGTSIVNQNITSATTYKQPHTYATTGKYNITVTAYRADNSIFSSVIIPANIVDCSFRTNRMIRTNLLNTAQQEQH